MNERLLILDIGPLLVVKTSNNLSSIMTQTQYTKAIEQEIMRLNKRIDAKILKGEAYGVESQKHKALLQKIRYQKSSSFFTKFLFSF